MFYTNQNLYPKAKIIFLKEVSLKKQKNCRIFKNLKLRQP